MICAIPVIEPVSQLLVALLNNERKRLKMSWEFDKEVANNFDYIADTSIPKYRIILYKTLEIIKENLPLNAKILEVGCANGNTMRLLENAGFKDVLGVDNSQAMIDECNHRGYTVRLDSEYPTWAGKQDAVIANWTLHFIVDRKQREKYIKDIYNNLRAGGIFILSEKVQGDDTEYLNFKRANFLSEEDIAYKRESLRGVLEPWKEHDYTNLFLNLGFSKIEVIDRTYCFRTFLVKK